jgi:NAD(P)-dependent dehydrogenase (short-subunit alcohol dehydrogenase family)
MTTLVFGGRSPIALALCKQLRDTSHEVHLVTRKIDPEIQKIASQLNISVLHQCDLLNSMASIDFVSKVDQQVNGLRGIAFLHRYRSKIHDSFAQYAVEVYTPYQILESLAKVPRLNELAVVLTSSPAATGVVSDQNFQYHASKAATEQLVRFASVRFAKNKLRTNGINPGALVFKERAAEFYKNNPQILEEAENSIPLGRVAQVSDIASVVMFLLSESSSFINGQIINVDGGLSNITR